MQYKNQYSTTRKWNTTASRSIVFLFLRKDFHFALAFAHQQQQQQQQIQTVQDRMSANKTSQAESCPRNWTWSGEMRSARNFLEDPFVARHFANKVILNMICGLLETHPPTALCNGNSCVGLAKRFGFVAVVVVVVCLTQQNHKIMITVIVVKKWKLLTQIAEGRKFHNQKLVYTKMFCWRN